MNNKLDIKFYKSLQKSNYCYILEITNNYEKDFNTLKKESIDILKLMNVFDSPLFNKDNICNCYFFPIENINISNYNDDFFPIESIQKNLINTASPMMPLEINLSFDHTKNTNVSVISFSNKYTKFFNGNNISEITDKNYLRNSGICFNLNTNVDIIMKNVYGNPYNYCIPNEFNQNALDNLNAYMPIKDNILFCLYIPLLEKLKNDEGIELYKDMLSIDKNTIYNNIYHSALLNPNFGNKICGFDIDKNDIKKNRTLYESVFSKDLLDNHDKIIANLIKTETYKPTIQYGYFIKFHVIASSFNVESYYKKTLIKFKSNIFNYQDEFYDIKFINNFVDELIKVFK